MEKHVLSYAVDGSKHQYRHIGSHLIASIKTKTLSADPLIPLFVLNIIFKIAICKKHKVFET